MEEITFRSRKQKLMRKLRFWASDNNIELYGTVKEARGGTDGYMQNGSTRKGTKIYCVNESGIYVWGGEKGWIIAKSPVNLLTRKKKVKNNLAIEMYDNGKYVDTFDSITDCSINTGIAYQTIYSNLRGFTVKIYGKYTFNRVEQQEVKK